MIACIWRKGCTNPRLCEESHCCSGLETVAANPSAKRPEVPLGSNPYLATELMRLSKSFTGASRAVLEEAAELLGSASETTGDELTVTFPRAWAPYLQAVILGAVGDMDADGDCRWHLNNLAKFLGRASEKTGAPHEP